MARLRVVETNVRPNTNLAHRASPTEGEAVRRLLEDNGYVLRGGRAQNGQYAFTCPFHEGPGSVARNKSPNFYVNAEKGVYTCHSASCGERGNLQTLERFFGIDVDDSYVTAFKSKDAELKEFERHLTTALRKPFYEHGLTDDTIARFRLGYDPVNQRYVIPYLEGRRPVLFRYYNPDGGKKKYTWEEGATTTLYNAQDAIGDANGQVFLCEGEQKAMLLCQMGYAAVAVPGAGQWRPEWQAKFIKARQVLICFDNDNPEHHIYDKPDEGKVCRMCESHGRCQGHNPGQEAAMKRLEDIGWRARNVLLPLPEGKDVRKTDINDYFMRDGHSNADFAELATGKRATPYKVMSLQEISENPPETATFLVAEGILPRGGRLLIAGRPKVGKSIFVDNLALSLAAGVSFLDRFPINNLGQEGFNPESVRHGGVRTLLLDRELSKYSLYSRLRELIDKRPAYGAAMENLLIDHDHLLRLDHDGSYDVLSQLVEQNGAEVVILDTAYKFLADMESSKSLMKAFEVLDKVIHNTGVSIVMTHHMKKSQGGKAKENNDIADPDSVAGSFLWTGWPNATILLNFLNRSVENPFNSIATFTAFRDHAAPEPLALYRDRSSIAYSAITPYSHDEYYQEADRTSEKWSRPSAEALEQLLLEACPTTEEDFLNMAAARYGVSVAAIRPHYLDAMSRGSFEKTNGHPPILRFKYDKDKDAQSWEEEHGLPDNPLPPAFTDVSMFGDGAWQV